MQEKITKALEKLEQERGIQILYACESGSRAWGFPSPDSDYDVRFLYVQPLEWYLRINDGKDTIDLGIDEDLLDITGWELRKTLQLLRKSNASPIDWIQSPIVYQERPSFREDFAELARECFSPIATLYHYLSMAQKYAETCASPGPQKLKGWFYALRTSLNCRWIIRRRTAPPIVFTELLDLLNEEPALRERIEALMVIKQRENETFFYEGDPVLLALIQDCIREGKEVGNSLPGGNASLDKLNQFFQKWVLNDA